MWGPAWVAWRAGDGYVGWAALPPRGVSVTATYGYRSPWRFSRAADLGAARPRCLPARDTRGMFHRTLLVTNDRVLTRGGTTVHINAGPRHVTNAAPVRLTSVAPQAFPQRAIYPRTGVSMSARPWIRSATTDESPVENRAAGHFGGAPNPSGAGAGHLFGRAPARTSPPATHVPSGSYTPPLRTYNPAAAGRAVGTREQPTCVREQRAAHLQPRARQQRASRFQPAAREQRAAGQ